MVGLGTAALAAFVATVLLRLFGQVVDDLILAETTMGEALTQIGPGSLMVAATAGVAGMLAFERPGGAAVGVAISVTTIPAAAYVGAALGMGRDDPMWGALVVLLSNVAVLVLAGSATLVVQRRSRRRHTQQPPEPPSTFPRRAAEEADPPSRLDRLGPRRGIELAVDRLAVGLHGVAGDVEPGTDRGSERLVGRYRSTRNSAVVSDEEPRRVPAR